MYNAIPVKQVCVTLNVKSTKSPAKWWKQNVESSGKDKAEDKTAAHKLTVDSSNVADYLGVYQLIMALAEQEPEVGRVTGLAWTQVGGELLTIEAVAVQGKGELSFTGSLGDVMKESIRAAMTVVRARADSLGVSYDKLKGTDIHVHMPEGATPKTVHPPVLR